MRKTPSHTEKKWSTASVPSRMELVLSLLESFVCLWLHQLSQPTKILQAIRQLVMKPLLPLHNPLTDTAVNSGKNESDISSPKNANASLEKQKKKLQQSQQLLLQLHPIQHHKPGKIVQMSQLLPTNPVTTETKAEEPIEDNYFRIPSKKLPEENKDSQGLWTWDDVENLLRTGLTEPYPLKMPKR